MGLNYFLCVFIGIVVHAQNRPNFIFILTDDQDVTLDSLVALPNTIKYIANEGLTFNNTFIATPICCPSRTETISGRNFHNIKEDGQNTCMHIAAEYNVFNNSASMFQIFHSNNYLTGSFGKLTNDMGNYWCNDNPNVNGFDRINCPCDYNNFYGLEYFDKFNNGTERKYELTLNENAYETSYVGNATLEWLKERMEDQKDNINAKPFIMWIGPHAPHYPATPASWYADRYSTTKAPVTPNYNQSDSLKHDFVGTNPHITENASQWIDQLYRDRLRSLLSVDDMVYDIFNLLEQYENQLDNTYILFTSDHGYHLGQYDVPCSKQQPYEETIRIPMFFRGPNIPKNMITYDMVGNIDILPTFLSLAGIQYDDNTYDGMSWTNGVLNGSPLELELDSNAKAIQADNWRTTYLTQYESVGTYGFSHCQTWFPSANGSVCPGELLNPPEDAPNGQPWLVDNTNTNNWRALRVINTTNNFMYAEFYNKSWDNATFENPYFYEYYDINSEPFQLTNQYNTLNTVMQQQLHSTLMAYGSCEGTGCWYTD